MTAICQALGLARSHVHALRSRSASWVDGRTQRTPHGDEQLLADIREQITELPSYGYRRACALVNRRPASSDAPRGQPKHVYRVMADNALLLPKAPRPPQSSRAHTGTVSVQTSDTRWCSDGLEIKCDSGQTMTATFAKEAMPAGHQLQFMSDNGSAYIPHETRRIARSLGLTPVNTPVCSPLSNGMAESFVNTFKRDYVSRMDLSDARAVLAQLPAAFEHFNEVHPHSSLRVKSPREFRRQRVEQSRRAQPDQPALHCASALSGLEGQDQPIRSERAIHHDMVN